MLLECSHLWGVQWTNTRNDAEVDLAQGYLELVFLATPRFSCIAHM
jgi:hypothetical protein